MPKRLRRYYGRGDLHFITFGCYHRMKLLGTVRARNALVKALEEIRKKYRFSLVGYVVMPDHGHLLIGESEQASPSTVVHGLKLRVSKRMRGRRKPATGQMSFAFPELRAPHFWQRRFYDFNLYSAKKVEGKAGVYASQSCDAKARTRSDGLDLEQLLGVFRERNTAD